MARRARTRRIRISDLSKVVNEVLKEYSKGLVDAYNEMAKKEAEKTADDLQKTSPKRAGKYAKGWTYKKIRTDAFGADEYVVFNESRPGLTHPLEHGHPVRVVAGGPIVGRAEKIPHIEPAEQRMIRRMLRGVKELDPNNP